MIPQRRLAEGKVIPWWLWVLGIDLFLIIITALKQYPVIHPGKGWLSRHFNLAVEMNAGVWWAGICLLAAALLAWEVFSRREEKSRVGWLVLSVVLAGLSLDEIGSLHERVADGPDRGWRELMPYGVALIALAAYALAVLFRSRGTRVSALFIGGAFLLFGSVALQEQLGNSGLWPEWADGIRIGVEEGTELMGAFLIFMGIIPQRPARVGDSLRALIPNPFSMKHLPPVVLAGFILHSSASLLLPGLIDVTDRGNPLVWYPSAVFFLLFSASFWKCLTFPAGKPKAWAFLSLVFLLASVGFVKESPSLLPVIGGLISEEYLPSLFFFSLIAVMLPFFIVTGEPGDGRFRHLPVLFLLPLASLLDHSQELRFFIAGFMTFLIFDIFWRRGLMIGQEEVKWEYDAPRRKKAGSSPLTEEKPHG